MESQIFTKIKEVIVKLLEVEGEQVTMQASFRDDLGADSLDIVELGLELEKMYSLTISEGDYSQLQTVGDAVSYLMQRMAAAE